MFERIIQIDKNILIYLNNLGNETWDPFWLFITNQLNWAPVFLLILFLIFKNFGWKKGGVLFLFLILMVAFSDQFTNMIRGVFERLRPNNDTSISHLLRTLIRPQRPQSLVPQVMQQHQWFLRFLSTCYLKTNINI